jgi:hypothetical protein
VALTLLLSFSMAYISRARELKANSSIAAALLFSVQSVGALLHGPTQQLSVLGEWIQVALRFFGPILLGLAILSIRGRVKR